MEFDSADVYGGVVSNSTNNNGTLEKENEVRYRGQTRHFLFCTFIIKNYKKTMKFNNSAKEYYVCTTVHNQIGYDDFFLRRSRQI